MADLSSSLGRRVAPPRFLLFILLFGGGIAAGIGPLGVERAVMAAFDAAAAVFLLSAIPLFRRGTAREMREYSRANDANRTLLLIVTGAVTLTVLGAVGSAVSHRNDPLATGLVVATLVLSWTFTNLVYALHYAHLYYRDDRTGDDSGGLKFRDCDEPDYWDFLYFSNTLGMAFATSDTLIASRTMRRIALGQTYAAFIFNLGVIAFAVGALGGG